LFPIWQWKFTAATGRRNQCPQEGGQEVEVQEPQLLVDVLPIFPPKTDISFSIFLE